MDNNVIRASARAFQELGWSTLRFNFRGVGRSTGNAGEGEEEVWDVRASLRFMREQAGVSSENTILLGYSFGAWVGLRALLHERPLLGWVAVAPPVGIWDFSFAGPVTGRKLVVVGELDPFAPGKPLADFLEVLQPPKRHLLLAGGDHFLRGLESTLCCRIREAVQGWIGAG